jgi:RNA polymerase sigma factor (sigma-70 family)
MTDEQLLDGFISRGNEAAEAAFEALLIRHGPMVFRVCRSVLRDAHDAEDAFQAVFLVLAQKARSIRRRRSVASWLFGVAHRVASRARSEARSRRDHEVRVAVPTIESYLPGHDWRVWATLHDEINRLPERLRVTLTLCYLEGQTYAAASQQLGVPEATVRGRLARARERLRRRLNSQGVTIPAGLVVAGTTAQPQAAIPTSLACSTVRIALGFMAGKSASVLARGMLNSMLLNQLKVAAVLILMAIGGRYCAWNAIAALEDDKSLADPGQVVGQSAAAAPAPASKVRSIAPSVRYRLSGTVRVEGTGEPAAGVKLQLHLGDRFDPQSGTEQFVKSAPDGRFAVDLPAGPVLVEIAEPPLGYFWARKSPRWMDSLFVGPDLPAVHRDYLIRKGTIWDFQFTRGAERKPAHG